MPVRIVPFVDEEIYHCFNKTIGKSAVFIDKKMVDLFRETAWFYRSQKTNMRHSHFARLDKTEKEAFATVINDTQFNHTDFLAYTFMPNHFHFIIRQRVGGSIEVMMRNILISFTRYFNTLNHRQGPLFLTQFKAVRIVSEEQLIHNTRYLHLNHYSAGYITDLRKLVEAPSSYHAYVDGTTDLLVDPTFILKMFSGNRDRYRKFVEQHAEHQKTLEYIKHVNKWGL